MSKELVISKNRHETKVAVLEDDQLVEVSFQRANEYSLAGSIHKGRVTRVLPGMQSAFVDLGLERDTFLYVSDFFEENPDIDTVSEEKISRPARFEPRRDRNGDREKPAEVAQPALVEDANASNAEAAKGGGGVAENAAEAPGDALHERRGRRSRRRRSRGRGFPDTKYARPSVSAASITEEPHEREEAIEEASSDVVVLPGESLAKYRHVHSDTEPAEAESEPVIASEEEVEGVGGDEAREIPPPEAIPELLDETEEQERHATQQDVWAAGAKTRSADYSIHLVSEIDEPIEPIEIEESETVELEAEFAGGPREDEPASVFLEAEPESTERSIEEAPKAVSGEPAELSSGVSVAGGQAAAEPEARKAEGQTASVREQGGRYMHRVSRRMRRRRGRFGPAVESSEMVGGATGAATASATETRGEEAKQEREERETKSERALPSITDLLKSGQEIIVQIAKEPLGQKGARITSHVALPGRYVVFMPSVEHLGVSRKIASEEERHRLKKILQAHRAGTTGGFIVRTAGEGRTEDEIASDMNFLYNLWLDIRQKAEKKPAPLLLHCDLDVVQRILRDQLTDEFKAIWVDNEEMYESVASFVQRFQPALVGRVKLYTRNAPIFDAFNITQELEKALRPKVWLKSGGYIVINQTEALVAIDVNTGKFVGKSNRLEDTIVKTNTEAVKEIVRQIRLRDLGGIIVVDFIDMDERRNRQKVMQTLEEAMHADKAPYKILQFNDFGLVAITRKRVKQSLERTLCAPCPYCEGAGYVKSVQTVISDVLVEAQKIAPALDRKDAVLRCNPEVAKVLKSKDNQYLEELEEILGRPVLVSSDGQIHLEKFDLA
ncbi:MAG: Rne/Rng family ribonuclease [Bryobacteraceae bacterium]